MRGAMEQSVQTETPQAAAAPRESAVPQATAASQESAAAIPQQAQSGESASPSAPAGGYQAGPELEAERAALAGARERSRMERARLTAEEQVRQIGKLDGRIQSLSDLIAMPEYGEFYGLVKKGMDLVQAYKVTCCDRLMKQAAEAASRQTMRSVASRQHLTPPGRTAR